MFLWCQTLQRHPGVTHLKTEQIQVGICRGGEIELFLDLDDPGELTVNVACPANVASQVCVVDLHNRPRSKIRTDADGADQNGERL